MQINRILIIADELNGDSAALSRAVRFAGKHDARLTLLCKPGSRDDVLEDAKSRAGLNGAKLMEYNTSPDMAIESMSEEPPDLIIKTASPDTGKLSRVFRNPDAEFAQKFPCPIWIIKSDSDPEKSSRVLSVVDPISTNPESQRLATRVLDTAVTLAMNDQAELHVLNAWEVSAEAMLRGRTIHVSDVDRLMEKIGAAHEKHLRRLVSKFDYPRISVHVRKGRARNLIRRFVRRHGIDDIVIGMPANRPGLANLLPGSRMEKFLAAANRSIFTVKPTDVAVEGAAA